VVAPRLDAPLATQPVGVRPWLAGTLFAALGTLALLPALSPGWSGFPLPPPSGAPDDAHNLRILETMLTLEGIALWAMALLAWRNPIWLRDLGGDAVLERHPVLALGTLLLVHLGGVLLFLPPQQIASGDPIYSADHAVHLYRAFGARQLLAAGGIVGGYDPFVNAGTPWILHPDSRGFEWFARLVPFLGLATCGKLWVLGIELLVPVVLWSSARLTGLDRRAAWFGTLLGLVYWHAGRPFLGHYRWNGDHSYLLATLLSLFVCALSVRFLETTSRGRRRLLVVLWPMLGVAGFVHPLGLVLPVVPLLLLMIWSAGSVSRRARFVLALLPVSLVFLNMGWMEPLVRQRTELPVPAANLQLRGLADALPLLRQVGVWPLVLILGLGAAGAWSMRQRHSLLVLALGSLAVCCGAIVLWGYGMPGIRRFETARFLIPAVLALCVLAGAAAAAIASRLRVALGTPLLVLLLVTSSTLPAFAAMFESRFFYAHRVHAILPPDFHRLMETLQEGPGPGARLLFESTRRGWISAAGDDGSLEALVPMYTHRQVMGLDHPALTRRTRNLAFGAGQLAGRPYAAWDGTSLRQFLDAYDIGTLVAWSRDTQRFLSRFPEHLLAPRRIGDVQVFTVREWHSGLEGKAQVTARFDRIELREIRAPEIVLPYHWQEDLRATPPVAWRPVRVPGAAAPFVAIQPDSHDIVVLHR